jgi:O-acetyl-ADP-ribose deacetylase (regulator of RNase III)
MDRWRTWNAQKLPGRAVCRHVRGWLGSQSNAMSAIEVHRTACVVTHPPGGERANDALINPANERLDGTQFSPQQCWTELHGDPVTGRWDKEFSVYPHQAVDGLVTEFGGPELRAALEALPLSDDGRRCAVGSAVATPAFSELREVYAAIIHAPTPPYRTLKHDEWAALLEATYYAAFSTAHNMRMRAIAVPLLGAGTKGAPALEAMHVAASAAVSWRASSSEATPRLRFGVSSSSAAHALVETLEVAIAQQPIFEASPPPEDERWALG